MTDAHDETGEPEQPRAASQSTAPSRLLIVEDDDGLRRAIRRVFREDYEVLEAEDGAAGLELALRLRPAVVIADQRMPKMTGVELLCQLRDRLPRTARILVTGYDDYGPVVDAINAAGIHHYFEKPFHPYNLRKVVDTFVHNIELEEQREQLLTELRASVQQLKDSNAQLADKEAHLSSLVEARTAELREANDELRELNEQLRDMAVRDGLTGLYNHRYLVEFIEVEIARSARYGRTFSLLFLDLDDFKLVNDQHGHQAGDAVLRGVAELLSIGPEGLRRSDVSARYGGEEFCVVLPETPIEGAHIKAERIRKALEARRWTEFELPADLSVTISIGAAAYPQHGNDVDAILRAADNALYMAKKDGKNKVVLYTDAS